MSTLEDRAANTSLYFFEPAELDPDTLRVVRFEGTEGISQPFNFELQLISEDPDLDFGKVVNKPATFTMMRGDEPRPIRGIVTEFSICGRTADYVVYQATLQPRLHWLSLSYRSRIFQEKKVEDILRTVLEEDGLSSSDFKFKLQESYSPREYCVQYEETDLNFASRLMEFEGMYYFFEHGDGQDTLVVTDKKSEHEKIPDPVSLQFHQGAGGMVKAKQETVSQFVCEEQVVTGKVELKDYNYRTPETMTAESEMNSEMPGKRYEYGEHFRDTGRGNRLAKVRNEEIEAQRKVLDGESDSLGLRSGFLFTLEKHYRKSLNADYLITQVEHQGSQRHGMDIGTIRSSEDKEESEPTYQNRFTCIPATVQYRAPRKTPKPEVSGVMTAEVDGSGDYAYLDDQGRYRAKMHFDQRDKSPGTATHPIRMKQPYSGKGEAGFHKPSHPGTEMIFACENGDPDRPMALGTAPNPNNESPVDNENSSQHIFQTTSENKLVVEDQGGAERISFFSPYKNSLVTIGSGMAKNEGITASTDGGVGVGAGGGVSIHGGKGVLLSAWSEQMGGKATTSVLKTVKGALKSLTAYASTKFSGGFEPVGSAFDYFTSAEEVFGNLKQALVDIGKSYQEYEKDSETPVADAFTNLDRPGVFATCEGGVDVISKEDVTLIPGGGFSVYTPLNASVNALAGIEMITGKSIEMFSKEGVFEVIAEGSDEFHAINLDATNKSMSLHANKVIRGDGEEQVVLNSDNDTLKLNAGSTDSSLEGESGVKVKAGNELVLECGSASITLKKSGKIEIDGKIINIDGNSVEVDAMDFTSKSQGNTLKGTMVEIDSSIVEIKGSINKIG
jgi:type VI secretion system secreted protein VgrG